MAPVIQLVHFIQAIRCFRQYQNRRCRVSIQNRSIKVPINSLECISITNCESLVKFLVVICKYISFRGEIVIMFQSAERNACNLCSAEFTASKRSRFKSDGVISLEVAAKPKKLLQSCASSTLVHLRGYHRRTECSCFRTYL